jgi:hypothetical protein
MKKAARLLKLLAPTVISGAVLMFLASSDSLWAETRWGWLGPLIFLATCGVGYLCTVKDSDGKRDYASLVIPAVVIGAIVFLLIVT